MNQVSKFNNRLGITGSSGFIGSHLTAYLQAKDIDYYTFTGDLLQTKDIETFFKKTSVTDIIHLAGTFDIPFENLLNKNVIATQNILNVGTKFGLKKIIFASTGAVYGEPILLKSKEVDHLAPNTLYGLTKKMAEDCVTFYKNNETIKAIILRFPNVYGEYNDKGVIYHFLSDIKNKAVIEIAGDGNQSRNFLHVSDACLAIEKALAYKKSNIFNISNDKKITINQLIGILQKKYTFQIRHKPADNNLKDLLLNTSKAKKELGFSAQVKQLKI